jgi:hypothetical protein
MSIDPPSDRGDHDRTQTGDDPALHLLRQREGALFELNERIARLAMLLDAPLRTEEDLRRVLARDLPVFTELRATRHPDGSERRKLETWEELRGLLTMRYDVMAQTLTELGLDTTRQLTQRVEERMGRAGFAPGADGFVLLARLNRDER